jgi:tRNA A-37 threonylcarbamoyl transferase component Bud32
MTDVCIVTNGAATVIHDEAAYPGFDTGWFDETRWNDEGALFHTITGRGGVLMLDVGGETWVRRHYHRGGLVSKLVYDEYLWNGLERSRPIREWRLLDYMHARALPVPKPVAARAVRSGPIYRADIITVLLPDTRPLSSALAELSVGASIWSEIGSMLWRFHAAGVDHPDLTAHNILLDSAGRVFLLDFDNARLREPGPWARRRMARLKRSLRKVALETGTRFDASAWERLLASYGPMPV